MTQDRNIAEHLVHHIWDSGHLELDKLRTTDGRKLEIIHRGKWNTDSGPDFKDALITLDNELQRGDIEIHGNASEWKSHGHQTDSNYNRVILHAVMWEDNLVAAEKEDGKPIPTLVLSNFLDEPLEILWKKLETLETSRSTQRLPCLDWLKAVESKKLLDVIYHAADVRQEEKVRRFGERARDVFWEQLLFEGIMEALGYAKNKIPFLTLARKIPVEVLLSDWTSILDIQSILFGVAGLLPSQGTRSIRLDDEGLEYADELEGRWRNLETALRVSPMSSSDWQFFRLRPTNFPTVRLAGMSFLLQRYSRASFFGAILDLLQSFGNDTDSKKMVEQMELKLKVEIEDQTGPGYWTTHYTFSGKPHRPNRVLIGGDRLRDVVVNVVIPIFILYSRRSKDISLREKLKQVYDAYPPASENEVTRFMGGQLLEKIKVPSSTRLQQGLIQIYKTTCYELRCPDCVVDRIRAEDIE